MKSITYKDASLTGKLRCSVFGHKFRPVDSLSESHREFECTVCNLHATNDSFSLAKSLRDEYREIHRALLNHHRQHGRFNQKLL